MGLQLPTYYYRCTRVPELTSNRYEDPLIAALLPLSLEDPHAPHPGRIPHAIRFLGVKLTAAECRLILALVMYGRDDHKRRISEIKAGVLIASLRGEGGSLDCRGLYEYLSTTRDPGRVGTRPRVVGWSPRSWITAIFKT